MLSVSNSQTKLQDFSARSLLLNFNLINLKPDFLLDCGMSTVRGALSFCSFLVLAGSYISFKTRTQCQNGMGRAQVYKALIKRLDARTTNKMEK